MDGRPHDVPDDMIHQRTVQVAAGRVELEGDLVVPENANGVVLFAHGSGSSRHSPRNKLVAQALNQAGLATLLLDLLSPDEEQVDLRTRELRFDIPMLADRLVAAAEWLTHKPETEDLRLGMFGASTGGGAALVAAAKRPDLVDAVVSRGGRPDLAGDALGHVQAATLLIVGGLDDVVIQLNRQAYAALSAPEKQLQIVPGATHLFEEPGTLEQVAQLASDWLVHHLRRVDAAWAA